MEGIRDGRAIDSCFLCGLLHPDRFAEQCPRCQHRMRYEPAEMLDATELDRRVRLAVERWRQDRSHTQLIALLEELHRLAPESIEVAARLGLGLAELRRAWEQAP